MTGLVLLEPEAPGAAWMPWTGVRPLAELRAGAWRIRERWERALGVAARGIAGGHVTDFADIDSPPVVETVSAEETFVAASWFAPGAGRLRLGPGTRRLTHQGETVAALVPAGMRPTLAVDGPAEEITGIRLGAAHELLKALELFLAADCADRAGSSAAELPAGTILIGKADQVVSEGALIEPGVVFDVRQGAVVLEAGAEIRSGTRLEGPCWIGAGARIVGGFIRGSVIGPRCVVRGEVSSSLFLGYANKAHDGFVGHSVIGHWVNFGAGTTTSNLKNTYGPIRLDAGASSIETGRTFLGSLIGDHAKTAIGTLLPTGTIIGSGANVFGPGPVPKFVPPLAWGLDGERITEEGFLRIAARVMPRRSVEFTAERADSLAATYRRLT
ncbi:MAG TPA: putative sugar nucleotidyl transferase [Gemmatimonadales bacterium]|nr:putative sugar nucleotidyl transferase [Gemmatimonadales bacterium]